jgi:hypothetical protein
MVAMVLALLVARRRLPLAQPSMMVVLEQTEPLAAAVAAAVRLAGLVPVITAALPLAAAAMQDWAAQAAAVVLLAVQALNMVRAMVLVAVAVATSLAAAVTDLLAVCMALLAAVHAAFLALVGRVETA